MDDLTPFFFRGGSRRGYIPEDVAGVPVTHTFDTAARRVIPETRAASNPAAPAKKKKSDGWNDKSIPTVTLDDGILDQAGVRVLLDHDRTMTETLETLVNDGKKIDVEKIVQLQNHPNEEGKKVASRVVVLHDAETKKPISIGLIKIDLDNLPDGFEDLLRADSTPFGTLLRTEALIPDEDIVHDVKKYYRLADPELKQRKFRFLKTDRQREAFAVADLADDTPIYGRHNVMYRKDITDLHGNPLRIARVYEFLAKDAIAKPPRRLPR